MKHIMLFEQWLATQGQPLLLEGGAAGHMNHPFDDTSLTFGDLKRMVEAGLSGNLTFQEDPTEKCLTGDTIVTLRSMGEVTLKEVVDNKYADDILSLDNNGNQIWMPIIDWVNNGETNSWLIIELECGKKIITTPNHRIFMGDYDVKAESLLVGDQLVVNE